MPKRSKQIDTFLTDSGWGSAKRIPIKGDASSRSYERLILSSQKAILMNAPVDAEAPCEPEGASSEERQALGYNAVARLAGPNLQAFAGIANALYQRGFAAPQILNADIDAGLMILEDLGQQDFAQVLTSQPDKEEQLYKHAVSLLAAIYRSTFPQEACYKDHKWRIRDYDETALLAETHLLLDWYAPEFGQKLSLFARRTWDEIWRGLFPILQRHSNGLALRDFHAENIFWLAEQKNYHRVGLIDFQDALFAHPAYDLVSLLEDARRDVNPNLVNPMVQYFCAKSGLLDDQNFRAAYALMGAQRNAKILGIFVRLAQRDNKPEYRNLIPRVKTHFQGNLAHPALNPVKQWCLEYLPEVLS